MESESFRTKFENQWSYETNSKWTDRTVKVAIREAILHTVSRIAEEAQLELMGKRTGQFPGLTPEEIDIIDKQAQFLNDYYRAMLKGAL